MTYDIEASGKTPVVCLGRDTCYWESKGYHGRVDAWDYFFDPVSSVSVEDLGVPAAEAVALDLNGLRRRFHGIAEVTAEYPWNSVGAFGMPGKTNPTQFAKLVELTQTRLRVRPEPRAKADAIWTAGLAGHDAVGMHVRGTDKYLEATPVDVQRCWSSIESELAANSRARIYLATDAARVAAEASKRYGDRVVMAPGVMRSDGHTGVHIRGGVRASEEALVDALVLARCRKLYHGLSNLAGGVIAMNPAIEHVDLSPQGLTCF